MAERILVSVYFPFCRGIELSAGSSSVYFTYQFCCLADLYKCKPVVCILNSFCGHSHVCVSIRIRADQSVT